MAQTLHLLCAFLLVSSALVSVSADAKTSAAVKAEIMALIKNKSKSQYKDYSTFLTYLQLGFSQVKNLDFTPLASATFLIPSNKAIAGIPSKSRTNITLLQKVVPFHIIGKKYTFAQISKLKAKAVATPKVPPLAPKSFNVFLFHVRSDLQFGPAAATPAAQRATVINKKLYTGKYFNCLGVNKVMKPPGVKW